MFEECLGIHSHPPHRPAPNFLFRRFVNTLARYLNEVKEFFGESEKIVVRNHRQSSQEMEIDNFTKGNEAAVSPRNKTKVAQDMIYADAFDDMYGETTMMDRVKRRPSVDAKKLANIGLDLDLDAVSPGGVKRKLSAGTGRGEYQNDKK